jgi:hypothetical protein
LEREGVTKTVLDLRKILASEYRRLMELKTKILSEWNNQGKLDFVNKVLENRVQIEDIVLTEDYYMTDLDLWILAVNLKLPLVLFSSTRKMKSLQWWGEETETDWNVLYGNRNSAFWFVRSPTNQVKNQISKYQLIDEKVFIKDMKRFGTVLETAFTEGDEKFKENRRTLDEYMKMTKVILRKLNKG